MFAQASRASAALAAILVVFSAFGQDGTWEGKFPMDTGVIFASSGVIDGKLHVVGGSPPNTLLQIYDPGTDRWAAGASAPTARCAAAAGVIDGRLYVAGGMFSCDSSRTTDILEVYDAAAGRWETKERMRTARNLSAGGVVDGKLYVIGGQQACAPCISMTTVEVYDPVIDKWASRAPMPTARSHHRAAVIDGKIYVVGGQNVAFAGDRGREVGALEVYDPATDTWETKATMPTPRLLMSVAALDGRIHAIGGQDLSTNLKTHEAYDAATDTWAADAPAPTQFVWSSAAETIGSKIYVAGRFTPSPYSITSVHEAFTPADKAAPVLTLPGDLVANATSPAGAVVNYTVSATDNADPSPTVACAPASGSTFPVGTSVVSCTATDVAGNSSNGTFSIVVNGAAAQASILVAVVENLDLSAGATESLTSKLENALASLAAGNVTSGCNVLSAFINQVAAQSGKQFTAAEADQLIAAANQVRAAQGCP